jgi:uncharacterized membrane protein YccF (DUF307 family)
LVHDPKGENFTISAGWRGLFSHTLRFAPRSKTSARFNPLAEIPCDDNAIPMIQRIVTILADPSGRPGEEIIWDTAAREIVDKKLLEGGSMQTDKALRSGLNIFWLVLIGWWLAVHMAIGGALLCVTLIGIPFGIQAFKLADAALWSIGKEVVPKALAREAQTLSAEEHLAARRAKRAS